MNSTLALQERIMKKILLLVALSMFGSGSFGSDLSREGLLKQHINMEDIDMHTCQRVLQMGNGKIDLAQCNETLSSAKAECLSIIREVVPEEPTIDEAKGMARILMFCPVAKILGIPFNPEKVMSLKIKS